MNTEQSKLSAQPTPFDELTEKYGPIVGMWETSFTDGRKFALVQLERTYLLCAINPNIPEEFRNMIVNLSPESMIGFQILYMCSGFARQKDDRAKFAALLDRKGQEVFLPILDAMDDVPADEQPLWPKETSKIEKIIAGALKSCINAHGPIKTEGIPSAVKRIIGQLSASECQP